MVVLLWVVLAAVVLFMWLAGNWFGRVLAFIALGIPVFVFSCAWASEPHTQIQAVLAGIAGIFLAFCLAWAVASIPLYYRRGLFSQRVQVLPPQRTAYAPAPLVRVGRIEPRFTR